MEGKDSLGGSITLLPPSNMLANKTGTITNGCASKPQIRNMTANEETRRKREVSNLIEVILGADASRAPAC
jgi:hypothetical protein